MRDIGFKLVGIYRRTLNIISHKVNLAVLVLKVLKSRVVNTVCLLDNRFNLAGLNALTVDFYHPVLAIEVDNIAVLALFDNIACFKQLCKAVLLHKGIINKGFSGLIWQAYIAVGKDTCKAELSFVSFVSVFIENICAYITDRLTNRSVFVRLVYLKRENSACGFGLSVHYINIKFIAGGIGYSLASCKDSAQAIALLLKYLKHFRADKGTVNLIFLYILSKQYGIAHCFKRH